MKHNSHNEANVAIHERFQTLIELIRPADHDIAKYNEKIAQVKQAFERAFPESSSILIGSFHRMTAIRDSDMDLLFFIPPEVLIDDGKLRSSRRFLEAIAKNIKPNLPRAKVSVSSPAIVVKDSNDRFEINIVPGAPKNFRDKGFEASGALITDGNGGWIETAPRAHDAILEQANKESHGMLNFVARFFKFWRTTRARPLKLPSFYVELVLARSGCCRSKSFPEAVWRGFSALHGSSITGCDDPLGLAERMFACESTRELARLESALRSASGDATKAYLAQLDGDVQTACASWNRVFGGHFPEFRTGSEILGWGARQRKAYPGTRTPIPNAFL